ncbi:DUF294 nucleotidyltransferase-like domain-containing protein [Paenalcaligenes niemegkensis]|uniref:DUF294 nucleotidyltransferase-like domain-containing protein n=1 Tax=Paenalcaligenes niemegkensis TaxID=2895469 RepID=UPI002150AC14|nr:DUF294 nucleotidyltransferase-like domain-containing protein [Paenalcaligenes niemegkensis]MCQ9616971.1 DUF294 nucleotidyltransferase-like domain-containing protein [Paenalcaligenes niemegkensis]
MTKNYDHTGQPAVTTNTQTIVRFLQDHVPFGQMEQTHQLYLADHCELRSFKAGDILFSPESGQVKRWYLLFDGEVKGIRQSASADHPDERFSLTPGDAFPVAALLGERPTRTQYTAATACQCLVLQIEPFERLLHASEPFRLFAFQGISPLLASLQQQAQAQAARIPGDDQSLDTPLQQLLTRTPVSCTPDTTLEAAVKLMHGHQVSSVAITDESGKLEGIFTLRDLRRVFADASVKRSDRISGLMTKTLHVLEARHSAYDAAMLMTRHHIGHVCIVENGHLAGVLSERDLFALQRVDLVRLSRAIRYADSVNSLQQLRSEMPRLVNSMLAHGAQAMQITALITQLNDHTTTRIIELMLASHGNPDIEFCWLAFGSEGRHEQTLLSDQDNGILFLVTAQLKPRLFARLFYPSPTISIRRWTNAD